MATITNAQTTASAVGIREGLTDRIHRVDVEETPIISMIGETTCKNTNHEWQTRDLGGVDLNNAAPEGDQTTNQAPTQNVRLGNLCQISKRNATVSGTMEAVDTAGRNSELALQMADRTIQLRKDMEAIMFSNQAYANAATRKLRGFEAWIRTHSNRGAGGAAPADPTTTPTTTATDGTARDFAQTQVDAVMKAAFLNGSKPTTIVMGANAKEKFSTFAGRTGSTIDVSKMLVTNNVTRYETNFGAVSALPHQYIRQRSALLIDPGYVKVAYLRKFVTIKPGVQGDATTREILAEYTLEVCNEKAHGIVADLN
jgi:hypothetical protein